MILYSPELDAIIFLLGREEDGAVHTWKWALSPEMAGGHDECMFGFDWHFIGYL